MKWLAMLAIVVACSGGETTSDPESTASPAPSSGEVETLLPGDLVAIATDHDRYQFVEGPHGDELTIRSTLTAPHDQTVYVVNCNGQISTGLQSERDGIWEDVWVALTNQCLSEPIVISPGESHDYEFSVRRGSGSVVDAPDDLPPSGTYRVVWHGVLSSFREDSYPFGKPIPEGQRTSAPIVID